MSKCYVIKNKDGKYMSESCEFETNQLWQAQLFDRKEIAEFYCNLKENEVIECTICEGDLEKELEVYKRALELACKEHKIFGYCAGVEYMCDKTVLTCEECIFEDFLDKAREEIEAEKKDET